MKIECPENAAVVAAGYYPVTEKDAIDWRCKLFDDEGYEHRLIALGGVQVVTKVSFAYAIWDRRSGKCVSHEEGKISNVPMTDAERMRRYIVGRELLRELRQSTD